MVCSPILILKIQIFLSTYLMPRKSRPKYMYRYTCRFFGVNSGSNIPLKFIATPHCVPRLFCPNRRTCTYVQDFICVPKKKAYHSYLILSIFQYNLKLKETLMNFTIEVNNTEKVWTFDLPSKDWIFNFYSLYFGIWHHCSKAINNISSIYENATSKSNHLQESNFTKRHSTKSKF